MRQSFSCGQLLGPGVAHHGMRNLIHHAQAHVDAADVVITVTCVSSCSALDHISSCFLGVWVLYRRSIFQMWSVSLAIGSVLPRFSKGQGAI